MNERPLAPLLSQMTDGYAQWQDDDRRRRRRRHVTVIALSLALTLAVDIIAFTTPMYYSSYSGSYGPDAAPIVKQMLTRQ